MRGIKEIRHTDGEVHRRKQQTRFVPRRFPLLHPGFAASTTGLLPCWHGPNQHSAVKPIPWLQSDHPQPNTRWRIPCEDICEWCTPEGIFRDSILLWFQFMQKLTFPSVLTTKSTSPMDISMLTTSTQFTSVKLEIKLHSKFFKAERRIRTVCCFRSTELAASRQQAVEYPPTLLKPFLLYCILINWK